MCIVLIERDKVHGHFGGSRRAAFYSYCAARGLPPMAISSFSVLFGLTRFDGAINSVMMPWTKVEADDMTWRERVHHCGPENTPQPCIF
jgi:hypothetical protein